MWDLPPKVGSPGDGEEMWLAYGDAESVDGGREKEKKREKKERYKREALVGRDWEEGRWKGKTGEWRRRRWVRLVKRVAVDRDDD